MAKTIPQPTLEELHTKATQERDEYVAEANKQVAFLNGRIAMLEQLIRPQPQETKEPGPGQG